MAPYPGQATRRNSGTGSSSVENANMTNSAKDTHGQLAPPRPRFAPSTRNSFSASDNSDSDLERATRPPRSKHPRTRSHARRSSARQTPPLDASLQPSPPAAAEQASAVADPFKDGTSTPTFFYPPPSSFNYPFQAHPGNPDPIPTYRRLSLESLRLRERASSAHGFRHQSVYSEGYHDFMSSNIDLRSDFSTPRAPFMTPGSISVPSLPPPTSNVYRASAAAAISSPTPTQYAFPNHNRASIFRPPFLSPASRASSIWQPPSYPFHGSYNVANGSNPSLPSKKTRQPMPSTRLTSELTLDDKQWVTEKDKHIRLSWWLTVLFWFLGGCGGAALCYFDYTSIKVLNDNKLCSVFVDNFDTFDTSIWTQDVELGGFGNGEFQMTTASSNNLYTQNGQLYIYPTLTSDEIGTDKIFNGGNYSLQGCTTNNASACSTSSNSKINTVINPVQSARISTKNTYSIKYGKIEVRAKLPRGDWLWPAIWMLPVDSPYGSWPAGGEIDIMEARGNSPTYPAQGSNYVRSSLNYGPLPADVAKLYGWQSQKRTSYDQAFHIYTLEWTDSWMRVSVDSKINAMVDVTVQGKGGKSFWDRGKFPQTAQNGSTQVVVEQIYQTPSAPYDQQFYLIMDLAVGGTSGWFPDNVGNKPWYDGSATAMYDFAHAQDTWSATWPSNPDDRAFRIDYVKMWSMC